MEQTTLKVSLVDPDSHPAKQLFEDSAPGALKMSRQLLPGPSKICYPRKRIMTESTGIPQCGLQLFQSQAFCDGMKCHSQLIPLARSIQLQGQKQPIVMVPSCSKSATLCIALIGPHFALRPLAPSKGAQISQSCGVLPVSEA